jgi:hypothetical protein
MKKIVMLAVILATAATAAHAQLYLEAQRKTTRVHFTYVEHEVSAYAMGGISSLQYSSTLGSTGVGWGGGFGGAYTYSFTEMWGVMGGLEFSIFNGRNTLGNFADSTLGTYYSATGQPPQDYYFKSDYRGYEERQRAMYLRLPVMGAFTYFIDPEWSVFAAAGFKLGLSVYGRYTTQADSWVSSGVFPFSGQTFYDNPNHGWTSSGVVGGVVQDVTNRLKFKFDLSLGLEAGAKFTLTDNMMLYGTFYFSYGVLNVKPNANDQVLNLIKTGATGDPHLNFGNGSVMQSTQGNGTTYVDKLHLMEVGLKFRFAFALGDTRPVFFRQAVL